MEYRQIADTSIKVSQICFGGWQIGGTDWGNISEADAGISVKTAFENGINFFDTADYYGNGRSEEIIGKAIALQRGQCVISSKGGLIKSDGKTVGYDGSPEHLRNALHGSLSRLSTDYVDLYQLHWTDPKVAIETSVSELSKLKQEGKIHQIGLSNCTKAELARALQVAPIASVQLSYNMLRRDIEDDMLEFCKQNRISILAYNPLARGLLTGKYSSGDTFEDVRKKDPMFHGAIFKINIATVGELKRIATEYKISLLSLVKSWSLRLPTIASIIVGVKNASQIEEVINAQYIGNHEQIYEEVENVLAQRFEKISRHFWYLKIAGVIIRNNKIKRFLLKLYKRIRKAMM